MNVQLQPAQALKVEGLEFIPALAADKAGPRIKMRVQQRWSAGGMGLMNQQFDRRAGGRLNCKSGPADYFLLKLEGQRCTPAPVPFHPPLTGGSRDGEIPALGSEGIRDTKIEIVLRRGAPFQPEAFGQLDDGDNRFPQERNAAGAQLGIGRSATQIQHVLVVIGGERRFIWRTI